MQGEWKGDLLGEGQRLLLRARDAVAQDERARLHGLCEAACVPRVHGRAMAVDHRAVLAWATSHGIELRNAEIARLPGRGYGMVATGFIEEGDVILRVPHAMLLTPSDADVDEVGQTNALALALLDERSKSQSFWLPYIRMLPNASSFRTPLHLNSSEQRALRGTDLAHWTHTREANLARTHQYLHSSNQHRFGALSRATVEATTGDIADVAPASLEAFTWALSIAWSRAHTVNMRAVRGIGAARRPGLVPLGDLFNHAAAGLTNVVTTSDPSRDVFEFIATRRVAPGEEALLSYSLHGEPSNSKLFLDYGFCVPYSLHDEVAVPLLSALDTTDSQDGAVAGLLRSLQLDKYASAARLTIDGIDAASPPHELIAAGRVLALSPSQLATATPESVLGPQEPQFERAVLQLLAERLRARLMRFDQPLQGGETDAMASHEDDEHHLASGEWRRTDGAGCSFHVRAGERRILLHWWRRLTKLAADIQPRGDETHARWSGGSRQPSPNAPDTLALHAFRADAVGWDVQADAPLSSVTASASLEVHSLQRGGDVAGLTERRLRGVIVSRGSQLRLGDLAGCYTGALLGPDERAAKRTTGFEAYCFPINSTHVVDPTNGDGHVPSDSVHPMALVNEPTGDVMPNLTPRNYRFGLCRSAGLPGVPYYAVRDILPGEELTVCYGPDFSRSYKTVCSDRALLRRWTELQERLLLPLLL